MNTSHAAMNQGTSAVEVLAYAQGYQQGKSIATPHPAVPMVEWVAGWRTIVSEFQGADTSTFTAEVKARRDGLVDALIYAIDKANGLH